MSPKKKQEFLLEHYNKAHLCILTPREQKVLQARYGFNLGQLTTNQLSTPLTLKEVGQSIFEVTGETIRLIEKKAIAKLTKYDFSREPEYWANMQREWFKDSRSEKS